MSELDDVAEVMRVLRAPGGCPWDAEQTHESLVTFLIEESYELAEAIESGTDDDIREELGDVLLQVLFHAEIASSEGRFDVHDVAHGLANKLRSRHPHVFADTSVDGSEQVVANWEALKRIEKPERESAFDGIPVALPALARADKLLSRAARQDLTVSNLVVEAADGEAEIGHELLALVARARAEGVDPERALRGAVRALEQDLREREAVRQPKP